MIKLILLFNDLYFYCLSAVTSICFVFRHSIIYIPAIPIAHYVFLTKKPSSGKNVCSHVYIFITNIYIARLRALRYIPHQDATCHVIFQHTPVVLRCMWISTYPRFTHS